MKGNKGKFVCGALVLSGLLIFSSVAWTRASSDSDTEDSSQAAETESLQENWSVSEMEALIDKTEDRQEAEIRRITTNSFSNLAPNARPQYYFIRRLYNPNSGEHFYTGKRGEKDALVRAGWRYEGLGWVSAEIGDSVYRLYNPNAGDHHYTTSYEEVEMLTSKGWRFEGVAWKSEGEKRVYRQYNPNARTGSHNFTTSRKENNALVRQGWRAEGVAWYSVNYHFEES